jgi:uncharacterized protein YchJ
MTDYGLTSQQFTVICALSNGATAAGAAEQAGVHRNTIANWRRNTLPFQYALAHAQYDRALLFREKSEALADLAILQIVSTPPEPKKQVTLEIEKIKVVDNPEPQVLDHQRNLHNDAQSEPASEVTAGASAATPQPVHNSAQAPIRREHPKIGRNEVCPCGSGKKYKRCCVDSPLAQPLAAAA